MARSETEKALTYRIKYLNRVWKGLDILEKEELINYGEKNPIGQLREIDAEEYEEYIDQIKEFRLNKGGK